MKCAFYSDEELQNMSLLESDVSWVVLRAASERRDINSRSLLTSKLCPFDIPRARQGTLVEVYTPSF
jgi:hypothetical protein